MRKPLDGFTLPQFVKRFSVDITLIGVVLMARYRSAACPFTKMPSGIPYILANEVAERFSFSGMRGILVVFMTTYLIGRNGELAPMGEADAKTYYHLFIAAVYLFPPVGAFIADVLFGKYYTIIAFSLIYCLGHGALALDDTRLGLFAGLTLIAVGSGGIKPCVSANVGDQFGATNQHLLSKVFGWFYFSINVGALASALLTPLLLEHYGPCMGLRCTGGIHAPGYFLFLDGAKQICPHPSLGDGLHSRSDQP